MFRKNELQGYAAQVLEGEYKMTEQQKGAEKYLMQIRNTDKEINEIILKIDYLRYKASGMGAIRYDKDRVQTSPEDMLCNAITDAIELENHLYARYEHLANMRARTEQIISLWGDNNARMIEIYYLNRGSMGDVARAIGCSDRHAYRIKLDALEEFSKTFAIYSEKIKNNT